MSETKRLLAVRKALKARTPKFVRQEFGKFKKIKAKWTRPKGHHAKMRERRKGNPRMVNVGWKGPAAIRGLHSSGLVRVMVSTPAALQGIDKQYAGITIASAVGTKKRLAILAEAQKLDITVLNLDARYAEHAQKRLADLKASRATAERDKAQREADREKKAKPKESIETRTEEEKKKAEKDAKDKVLTQKG